jgi:4'-phosphopantetheinyl transferase
VEQALAARFRTARLALRYRATHAALRLILGARCGRAAASLAFATLAHGKPILCREPGDPPITFNLSHSGPIALIAVGLDQEIGVDVEALRPFAGMSSLAGQVLTAEEAASFRAEAEAKQLGAFYARWTAKEAAIKALGFGLALEPSLFSVEPAGFSASDAATPHAAALRRLALLPLAPLYGYAGALVVTAPLPEVALRRWPH